jgi:hypothetical protein
VLRVLQIYYDNNIEAKEQRITKVKEGIRFILTHFKGRQQLFPRKMSTSLSQGRQFTIYNEEQFLNECIKANFIDCRLNAYPVLLDGDMAAATQAPNLIFIDIDLLTFDYETSLPELNKTLSKLLKIIKQKLEGCDPTVLWTGNGYHIYIVLDTRPLELTTDLTELSIRPSKEFLKYAEISFTSKKADPKHNHSFNSYLLRIPHTFNSKCIDKNKNSEVTIIQKFDSQNVPQIGIQLLREFRLYLADLDIKNKRTFIDQKQKIKQYNKNTNSQSTTYEVPQSYQWIETLLQTPIPDHRKFAIDLLLIPYLLNIRHLSFNQTYSIITDWILKCNAFRVLQPSVKSFDYRIKLAINRSVKNRIPPIKRQTIMENYPDWYRNFEEWHLFD